MRVVFKQRFSCCVLDQIICWICWEKKFNAHQKTNKSETNLIAGRPQTLDNVGNDQGLKGSIEIILPTPISSNSSYLSPKRPEQDVLLGVQKTFWSLWFEAQFMQQHILFATRMCCKFEQNYVGIYTFQVVIGGFLSNHQWFNSTVVFASILIHPRSLT